MNKYYDMTYISKIPLTELSDLLKFAYDRELYERWLTIYPHMEMGLMEFVSFEDYKKKAIENGLQKIRQKNLNDEEIIEKTNKIIEIYNKQKGGASSGDI